MARGVAARRRHQQNIFGTVMIAGAIFVMLLVGGWFVYDNITREDVDKETGCLKRRYPSVTVVLLDTTDALTPIQSAALKNLLEKVKGAVPKRGRLEIYALQPITAKPLEAVFAGCNPGSGRDVESPLTGSRSLAERRWTQQFASKVDATLDRLLDMPPQDASPILEGIQSVAVTALGPEKAENAEIRQFVIVSDFIQHGPQLTMYRGAPDYAKFKDSAYYRQVLPKIRDVGVHMYWIARPTQKDVQNTRLRDFWREYVRDAGGHTEAWIALQ